MSKRCVKLVIALDNLGLIWSGDRQVASSNDTFKENTLWYIYIYVLFAQLAAVQTGPFKAACSRISDISSRMEGSSRSKSFTWKDHDQRTPHIDLWWSVHPSCLCFWSESDHESSLEQLWKAIHTSTAAAFLEICCSTAALSLFSLSKCSWATKKKSVIQFSCWDWCNNCTDNLASWILAKASIVIRYAGAAELESDTLQPHLHFELFPFQRVCLEKRRSWKGGSQGEIRWFVLCCFIMCKGVSSQVFALPVLISLISPHEGPEMSRVKQNDIDFYIAILQRELLSACGKWKDMERQTGDLSMCQPTGRRYQRTWVQT